MAIKKNDFSAVLKKYSSTASYKPQRFFDLGDAFLDATGLPGPAMGHINMFLGHSDTGKTTALIKTAIDCLRKDILPVFIVTEQKWDFSHAKLMGLEYEEEIDSTTGNISYYGNFIFNNDFKWIEQVTDFINELLDIQIKGEINKDICFFWDSVGSIPCKMTYDGKGGKQHNAAVLADKIGMDISTVSRVVSSKYVLTPYGMYSLKFFFSESMQKNDGEEVSSREIKKLLSDAIENEDKSKPLTDATLCKILNKKGYNIARRTIAKYREQLGIPVARMRK